jgi:hypothetical protein
MQYRIIKNTQDTFLMEITQNSFRTRIEFDWTPEEDFKGVAVCCNYHFKGNPIGFLKDNRLIRKQIDGKTERALFKIEDTDSMIQAGPSLIVEGKPKKNFKDEGFATHHILKGAHAHIGIKNSGNYVIGFTEQCTFNEMINTYQELNCLNAIKLPGLKQFSFYFKSVKQKIEKGVFPIPVALIFEPRLDNLDEILS